MQHFFTPVPFILSSEPRMMVSGSLGGWCVGGRNGRGNSKYESINDQDPAYHHREILSEVLLL